MRILIIGGTGVISTGITRQLLERDDDVTLYNRGQTASPYAGQVKTVTGDRSDAPRFEAQMAALGTFDCVIDMIAFRPADIESDLRAFSGRTPQLIHCSTVDVYQKPARRYPITEDQPLGARPSFAYAHDKVACERLLWAAHARGEINVTCIRPANTLVGGGRPVHTFGFGTYILDRMRLGLPIVLHGDGRSFWTISHRDDVARAFVGAIGNPAAYGRGYSVASDEWLLWDRYYDLMAAACGVPCPEKVYIPISVLGRLLPEQALWAVENFAFNNIFDCTAAKRDLGYVTTVSAAELLNEVVGWLFSNGQVEPAAQAPWYDRLIAAWRTSVDALGATFADVC